MLHVDGVFAQMRNSKFSCGNVPVDLTVSSSTVFNVVGKIPDFTEKITYEPINIENSFEYKNKNGN